MRTKIVYVLVSDNKDVYLEQTLVSVYSARLYMPNSEIVLVVDETTDKTLSEKRSTILKYISSKVVIRIEGNYTNMQRSRVLKTTLREHVDGDFLFIDSDTIVMSSLEEVDLFDFDIGAVRDHHVSLNNIYQTLYTSINKYAKIMNWPIEKESDNFNSGVMYVKDNNRTRNLYMDWHKYWIEGKSNGINRDQPALIMANLKNNHIITEISGVWNCQIEFGYKYFKNSKIIHYFASCLPQKRFLIEFMDENLYLEIKKVGDIDEKIIQMIKNPQDYITDYTLTICEQDLNFLSTYIVSAINSIYYNHPFLFNSINNFLKIISNLKNRGKYKQ